MAIHRAGDFFGEMEIFANEKRHFSAWAFTACILIAFKKEAYNQIFYRKYPNLGKAFKKIIGIRFNHFIELCVFADELLGIRGEFGLGLDRDRDNSGSSDFGPQSGNRSFSFESDDNCSIQEIKGISFYFKFSHTFLIILNIFKFFHFILI